MIVFLHIAKTKIQSCYATGKWKFLVLVFLCFLFVFPWTNMHYFYCKDVRREVNMPGYGEMKTMVVLCFLLRRSVSPLLFLLLFCSSPCSALLRVSLVSLVSVLFPFSPLLFLTLSLTLFSLLPLFYSLRPLCLVFPPPPLPFLFSSAALSLPICLVFFSSFSLVPSLAFIARECMRFPGTLLLK